MQTYLSTSIPSLLELALTESGAQGAYVYRYERRTWSITSEVWSGLPPVRSGTAGAEADSRAAGHFDRMAPIVRHEKAWLDPAFDVLPEFRTNRFEAVVSIPLVHAGQANGLVNVCRLRTSAWKPRELSFLLSLSVPITGLLTATQVQMGLQREVARLSRELHDRKVLDRAKGLIQSRHSWTEEQAYFCMRNLSRRRRIPMRSIAEEVIATGADSVLPAGAASR
jgi:signal transduction protein with GAF and PtsI domain